MSSVANPTSADSALQIDTPASCNVASHLPRMAKLVPDQPAVVVTESRRSDGRAIYASLTFAEMEALSNRYANALSQIGIARGDRVLVMVKPGFAFIGLAFALFKMGAVPVMIDPGMGINRLLDCVRSVDLDAFIGIAPAQLIRVLRRGAFRTVKHVVTVGRRWLWGGYNLEKIADRASSEFELVDTKPSDTAAILFTSGSTGPAKGVVYEHAMFDAQVRMIQACYNIKPGEVDLPALPLFALFSTAMGMTCVVPDMNPSKPAQVDPAKIVEAICDHNVTSTFGSPAIWKRVATYCVDRNIKLESLKRILIAGAPVPPSVIDQLHKVLPGNADVHTPYGATESLPISTISGKQILGDCRALMRHGAGICVGGTLPGVEVRIIGITDDPIPDWHDDLCVPNGEVGEVVVSGTPITKAYLNRPLANALAKIRDGERLWHRVGDVCRLDEQGRLWFLGRKSQRVTTVDGVLFADQCEAVFNEHPTVNRSALVGVGIAGDQTPVLVVELQTGEIPTGRRREVLIAELLKLGGTFELTMSIQRVLFHRSLPVDIRHNVKIGREALRAWAARKIR